MESMNAEQDVSLKSFFDTIAVQHGIPVTDAAFAKHMDEQDPLKHLRDHFLYPRMRDLDGVDLSAVDESEEAIYLCGNSLGLQPKNTKHLVERELDKWAKMGVQGHKAGEMPWAECDLLLVDGQAEIVGARTDEISVMNSLTVNLHVLMAAFYKPTPTRKVVLMETKPFPSDFGRSWLTTDEILTYLDAHGDSIALVLFSGVNYYSGQYFDIPRITSVGKAKGCVVGWDLAHAAGNVPLKLHEWKVDFATWCSYKYLNSGCGGLSVVFVHEEVMNSHPPALWGWWGHCAATRFDMTNEMEFEKGCLAYRISHPPALLACPMLASLQVFKLTTMESLRRKSIMLTGYLEYLIDSYLSEHHCEIITPRNPEERGCQISLKFSRNVRSLNEHLKKRGIVCDVRLPNVIRVTPVHLYNSFTDVYRFVNGLLDVLGKLRA
ncbi:kynureninase [Trichuris trichiura]|uniref:Kynureninase n=1 Tax=Trichuris trichiura TaxID=36087 RepID=A0A077YV47_TRITR|nr:kynureninase [Trichuris trichiura]